MACVLQTTLLHYKHCKAGLAWWAGWAMAHPLIAVFWHCGTVSLKTGGARGLACTEWVAV